MARTYNKGEWSELYAFLKLLKDGRIYAADEKANRMDDIYLPIIKIIREEQSGSRLNYFTGNKIKIYENGKELKNIEVSECADYVKLIFPKIFCGARDSDTKGTFAIPEIESFMDKLNITKVKAASSEKVDMEMQIHDVHTGYSPEVGFSVKSDIGSPPTLLNAGKNTRIRYKITGLSDGDMNIINNIDKTVCKEYIKARMEKLLELSFGISYVGVLDFTFEDNLVMIDSCLPRIYGELVLQHYLHISEKIYDCNILIDILTKINPIGYRRSDIYKHKFKKLISASALGMTPGKPWDGLDAATGGYIIIKKDGDVLCYHLYNRNYFDEYLLNNTSFDRPSATRHDYCYVYEMDGEKYIDLNVQIRFKTIK